MGSWLACRAFSRICWMGGTGRAASSASRSICSSSTTFGRRPAGCSDRTPPPSGTRRMAASSSPFSSNARAWSRWASEAAICARSRAIRYSADAGWPGRLRVVAHRGVPVAGPRRLVALAEGLTGRASGHRHERQRQRRRFQQVRSQGRLQSRPHVTGSSAYCRFPRHPVNGITRRPRPSA